MDKPNLPVRTIAWIGGTDGFVRLIDQTLLPTQVHYRDCKMVEEIWEAIRTLRVRGAPAIGVAAAMGLVLGMQKIAEPMRVPMPERCGTWPSISRAAGRPRSIFRGRSNA